MSGFELRDPAGRVRLSSAKLNYRMVASGTLPATTYYYSNVNVSLLTQASDLVFMRAAVGTQFHFFENGAGLTYYGANGPVQYRVYTTTKANPPTSGYGLIVNDENGMCLFSSLENNLSISSIQSLTMSTANIPSFNSSNGQKLGNPQFIGSASAANAFDGGVPWLCMTPLGHVRSSFAWYNSQDRSDSVVRRSISPVVASNIAYNFYEITHNGISMPSSTPNTWWPAGPPTRALIFAK